MKRAELERIVTLKKELKMWQNRRDEIEESLAVSAQQIDGMPFANTNEIHSTTEDMALRLMECAEAIDQKIAEIQKAVYEAEKFILSLGDTKIRQIVELRCVGGRYFEDIAKYLGDGYTADSVRQTYHRFMKELE